MEKPRYNVGDTVYFIKDRGVAKDTIKAVFEYNKNLYYVFSVYELEGRYSVKDKIPANCVFSTKEGLLKSL